MRRTGSGRPVRPDEPRHGDEARAKLRGEEPLHVRVAAQLHANRLFGPGEGDGESQEGTAPSLESEPFGDQGQCGVVAREYHDIAVALLFDPPGGAVELLAQNVVPRKRGCVEDAELACNRPAHDPTVLCGRPSSTTRARKRGPLTNGVNP